MFKLHLQWVTKRFHNNATSVRQALHGLYRYTALVSYQMVKPFKTFDDHQTVVDAQLETCCSTSLRRLIVPNNPDSKVQEASMGPIWVRQEPGGPHVGHTNLAIWEYTVDSIDWCKPGP